ncbi:MAG: hypothetical protein ACRYFZ_09725 [Janthinobacterium lividum]
MKTPTAATPAPVVAAAAELPITVMLRLECRGRRANREEWYQIEMLKPVDATLESLKPLILEKSGEAFGGSFTKRTILTVEQYDSQERYLLVSHTLPASQASAFTLDLEWGFGWKRIASPTAPTR